jgi:ubiquinone/menaquinone biosynthesis C-methylase UbiE
MSEIERRAHAELQRKYFDKLAYGFTQPISADVEERTRRIVRAAKLHDESRVLDVATGTGVLIAHFAAAGVNANNIAGCDLSANMLELARSRYPEVQFWQGDYYEFPLDMGKFDAIFFNGCFGNLYDPDAAIERGGLLLNSGGRLVIGHPLGATFVGQLRANEPSLVPHLLPDRDRLLEWSSRHNLNLEIFVDEPDLYVAVMRYQL